MGFKLLSFVFAYLAAAAFSGFPGQPETSSIFTQAMVVAYIIGCLMLSFALWTKRYWVIYSFILWCFICIFFMFVLQSGQLQMPWNEFAMSLAVIVFIQVLLGFYIHRSMKQDDSMTD